MSEFKIPEGAKPFSPDSIGDTKVAGLTVMEGTANVQSPAEVVVEKTIDLRGEDKAETKPAEVAIKMCPACGCNITANAEPVTTDDDKNRWLRHILGEAEFTQSYKLFDGKIEIEFRSRTTGENDEIFAQLSDDMHSGVIPNNPSFASPAYVTQMYRYMFTYSVTKIIRTDSTKPGNDVSIYPRVNSENYRPDGKDDKRRPVVIAHALILKPMVEGFLAALLNVHRRFEATVSTLIRHSEDPDFWRPTVAGG